MPQTKKKELLFLLKNKLQEIVRVHQVHRVTVTVSIQAANPQLWRLREALSLMLLYLKTKDSSLKLQMANFHTVRKSN